MGKKLTTAALFMLFFSAIAKADVVEPGEIHRQFLIANANKYPAYKFFYIYQGYHYDRGYQPGNADTTVLENNKRYFASTHGNDKSPLLAKDKKGNWLVSDIKLGGESKVSPSLDGVVDVYNIISIKNGVIKLKKIKEISIYGNGKEVEKKAGAGFGTFISGDGFTKGMVIASSAALVILLVLFIRRNRPKYVHLAT